MSLVSDAPVPEASSSHNSLTTSCSPATPPRHPSQRLETFEDLLKQAGYSQTRVITPKSERLAKDAATYSSHSRDEDTKDANSALTGAARYAIRVAKLLSWVSGPTVEQKEATNDHKRETLGARDHSLTPQRLGKPSKPRLPLNIPAFDSKSPVPSSSAGINPSAAASTLTVRPSPPLRHTTSSPQLPPSTSPNVTNSSNPNIYFPPQKSRQNSNRSSTKPTSSRPSKRSPLPDSWQESTKPREPGRTLRRRLPSEKLLARSGSLTSATAAAAAVASRKAHISPVTVSCRSASVDATTRHRRRKELPLLTPSADTGAWPWMAGSSSGNGKKEHSLPKINVHAANGKRSLARTGSTSSARGFSSLSRSGSIYANLSRRDRADDSSWAEYSHRNSPVVGNYKHLPQLQLDHAIHTDEDEDSDNEPHLANILAPHVSPLASPQPNPAKSARPGPVGRQQSIQSLRACLDKHESRGRRASVATPRVISPQFASFHDQNTIPPASAVPALTLPSPMQDGNDSQGLIKRRSMGHFEAQRRRDTSGRLSRQELQLQRQRERMENNDHVIERGRSGSKALLPPGLGTHHWQANERTTTAALASSRSPSQSVARTNGPPARRGTGDKPNDKLSQKELETERLLWGTSWGRK